MNVGTGLALGVIFVGYATLYYGITQLGGGNWGFLDLVLPSRAVNVPDIPRDGGLAQGPG